MTYSWIYVNNVNPNGGTEILVPFLENRINLCAIQESEIVFRGTSLNKKSQLIEEALTTLNKEESVNSIAKRTPARARLRAPNCNKRHASEWKRSMPLHNLFAESLTWLFHLLNASCRVNNNRALIVIPLICIGARLTLRLPSRASSPPRCLYSDRVPAQLVYCHRQNRIWVMGTP